MAEDQDASGISERNRPPRIVIVDIVIGAVVAAVTWWLIDVLSVNIIHGLQRANPTPGPFLLVTTTALMSTLVLTRSAFSLVAAIVVMTMGIVIAGYGSGTALINLGHGDHVFIIMRPAYAPVTWALAGAWVAMVALRLWASRQMSN